jgi:hypothetical protein
MKVLSIVENACLRNETNFTKIKLNFSLQQPFPVNDFIICSRTNSISDERNKQLSLLKFVSHSAGQENELLHCHKDNSMESSVTGFYFGQSVL